MKNLICLIQIKLGYKIAKSKFGFSVDTCTPFHVSADVVKGE